jgi:hypothetical protein
VIEALSLAYGAEIAARLMMIGRAMQDAGRLACAAVDRQVGPDSWVRSPFAYQQAAHAAISVLVDFRPEGEPPVAPKSSWLPEGFDAQHIGLRAAKNLTTAVKGRRHPTLENSPRPFESCWSPKRKTTNERLDYPPRQSIVAPEIRRLARPDGKRRTHFLTVRGGKKDAQAKLAEQLASVGKGTFVEPSKITVAEHVRSRIAVWHAGGKIGEYTAARYHDMLRLYIAPHLGGTFLQRLSVDDVEKWHGTLLTSGLGAGTVRNAHTVLTRSLRDAVRSGVIVRSVAGRDGQRRLPTRRRR